MVNKRRKKVSFKVTKMVPKTVIIEFYTKKGQEVSFKATKTAPKTVGVEFYVKRKKEKKKN